MKNMDDNTLRMFVNGQAMVGGTLHGSFATARPLGAMATAPKYRFFSVRDEFPGLAAADDAGSSIAGELYAVSYERLRDSILPLEPPELELGIIELQDASAALCMVLRRGVTEEVDVKDISVLGGWRAYICELEARVEPNGGGDGH